MLVVGRWYYDRALQIIENLRMDLDVDCVLILIIKAK